MILINDLNYMLNIRNKNLMTINYQPLARPIKKLIPSFGDNLNIIAQAKRKCENTSILSNLSNPRVMRFWVQKFI